VLVPGERPDAGRIGEALPRVAELPLAELILARHWALAKALQLVVDAAEGAKGNYAAHSSASPTELGPLESGDGQRTVVSRVRE
jgi:hypothetical protein